MHIAIGYALDYANMVRLTVVTSVKEDDVAGLWRVCAGLPLATFFEPLHAPVTTHKF